jgi:peptidoglycan/xylan/chitin deacetylase (PgdA/CDA1 family)
LLAGVVTTFFLPYETRAEARFVRITKYLNDARAVVSHTIDDSTKFVTDCIDAMDRYGIKATIFVSTEREPISSLWPRLQKAYENGHEIGSHARRHQCKWPDDKEFCEKAYSDYEIGGSRDDLLKNTTQPYIWSWCYPCGNCANYDFIQKRLAAAGYVVARNYPDEREDGHVVPNLQTWDENPHNAAYTQVVQKLGGIPKSGNTDVPKLNAKFDEVLKNGGIYNFLSHPQWLDYGAESFYEKHLEHISRRKDVWYVPMGPLYTYRTMVQKTRVDPQSGSRVSKFRISNDLDQRIYGNAITLEFELTSGSNAEVTAGGKPLPRAPEITDRWDQEYYRRAGDKLLVTVKPNKTIDIR